MSLSLAYFGPPKCSEVDTEDCLADAVAQRGITQYLIFGAGLDTFAFRQPPWARSLRIYEVDHPATQKWKRDRLLAADLVSPANLTFAPADFERMTLRCWSEQNRVRFLG